jgi:hypothetical protein
MLIDALYEPSGGGDAIAVQVGFSQPDTNFLDDRVQSTEYEIEYATVVMQALRVGETIRIGTDVYKVRNTPEKRGDGYFSVAQLTKQ